MTLATPQSRVPIRADGEVFAAGSTSSRRLAWAAIGTGLLTFAYAGWLVGDFSPSFQWISQPSALLLAAAGTLVLAMTLWRRSKAYQVRPDGLLLVNGGPIFGDKQLLPWASLTWFGGRRVGDDFVCLAYRQQHIDRRCTLPGRPIGLHDYDRLIDRLRVVLGSQYPHLKLGGLD